jgi:hypothetical protein
MGIDMYAALHASFKIIWYLGIESWFLVNGRKRARDNRCNNSSSYSNRNVNIIAEVIKCIGKTHINIGCHITNIDIFILISI